MKNLLVITYYWPPASGGGVQRILKFCKYLPTYGWRPVVLTARHTGNGLLQDESFNSEAAGIPVYQVDFWFDPVRLLNRTNGMKNTSTKEKTIVFSSFAKKLLGFLWLNLLVPDSKIGMYGLAKKAVAEIIEQYEIEAVFSSCPPYTMHLIGWDVKQKYKLPWIADFRDPWLENHAYNQGFRLPWIKSINRRLEMRTLRRADRVTCATWMQKELLAAKIGDREKITVITNGYDAADMVMRSERREFFYITHIGTIYDKGFPERFFRRISALIQNDIELKQQLRLRIIGTFSSSVSNLLQRIIPVENLELREYIPHAEAVRYLYQEQVLLLLVNEDPLQAYSLPAKLYEYLPTGNPILGFGLPHDDVETILEQKTGRGVHVAAENAAEIDAWIRDRFAEWKKGKLNRGMQRFLEFEREHLTQQLAASIEKCLETSGRQPD